MTGIKKADKTVNGRAEKGKIQCRWSADHINSRLQTSKRETQ
jgi:hypothetical protein